MGTSATAAAVVSSLDADRLSATAREIRVLYEALSALGLPGRRRITGIGPQRAEIIVPGTAILLHVVESLGMPEMFYSAGGVRDGIIAELAAS